MAHSTLLLNGNSLSIQDVGKVARREITDVRIDPACLEQIQNSRKLVEQWVDEGKAILDTIRTEKAISDDTKGKIKAALDTFAKTFG